MLTYLEKLTRLEKLRHLRRFAQYEKLARLWKLAYLGKSLTWLVTSSVALSAGLGALVLSKGAAAGTSPHLPVILPPHHDAPPVVPEVNTGLVLLPIVLAILLFSSRHLLRRQRLENR